MPRASFVDVDKSVFSGEKKLNQVGIVVRDEKKAAKHFEELLGIGNWKYSYGPPGPINAFLNGKPVKESEMQSLDVAFANGWLGDIQIEIIRPIGIRPGGCGGWIRQTRLFLHLPRTHGELFHSPDPPLPPRHPPARDAYPPVETRRQIPA